MMQWEKLLAQTAQQGGRVVFLQEPATVSEPLRKALPAAFATVTISKEDLLGNLMCTRPEDLIVFLDSQRLFVQELDAVLQGQRLWLGAGEVTENQVDYIWKDGDLKAWTQICQKAEQVLNAKTAISEFSNSFTQPCLFLDRDDVVVKNVPYNADAKKVELTPGISDLINEAHENGWWVALVTNQSGLGRGRIDWQEYQQVHQQMLKLLAAEKAWIDESVWATYIENAPTEAGQYSASLRKPRNGMFQLVAKKLKVKIQDSVMVGDSASDLIAANAAGIRNLYLLKTEKTSREIKALSEVQSPFIYQVIEDLQGVIL